jgi:hypothetical protein
MNFSVKSQPTVKEFWQTMELKIQDEEFLGDTRLLLRPDEPYNPVEAWAVVKDIILEVFGITGRGVLGHVG